MLVCHFKYIPNMNTCLVLVDNVDVCQNVNYQEPINTLYVANWAETKGREG